MGLDVWTGSVIVNLSQGGKQLSENKVKLCCLRKVKRPRENENWSWWYNLSHRSSCAQSKPSSRTFSLFLFFKAVWSGFSANFTPTSLSCFSFCSEILNSFGRTIGSMWCKEPKSRGQKGWNFSFIRLSTWKLMQRGSGALNITYSCLLVWKNNISQHRKHLHELAGGQGMYWWPKKKQPARTCRALGLSAHLGGISVGHIDLQDTRRHSGALREWHGEEAGRQPLG